MHGIQLKKASAFADLAGGCKVDMDSRTLEFYASVFDVRDSVGDIVERGAFAKTIAERHPKKLIKLGRNHFDMIGMPLELREDSYGLFVRGKVDKKPVGDEALEEAETGTLSHASFMYRTIQSKPDPQDDTTTRLTELKLYEVGPVYFPANEAAVLLAVRKALEGGGEGGDLSLSDLLSPVRHAVRLLAAKAIEHHERREVAAALKDLEPFVERLRALEAADGGPDPMEGTTRKQEESEDSKQGPEHETATTPASDEADLFSKVEAGLQALQRLRDARAA